MVYVAGEVFLTRHAKIACLVETVRLVISRAHHVRETSGDWSELIEEIIEDRLISFVGLSIRGIAVDESILGLFQPCVGIGIVASYIASAWKTMKT